jgi:hypothetical protein
MAGKIRKLKKPEGFRFKAERAQPGPKSRQPLGWIIV